jgi:carnitine 3-dehydrogenase
MGSSVLKQGENDMALDKPVSRIAIVGTGVIGASWAAEFLAKGFDVIATDPAPGAETALRKYVDAAWPALTAMGLADNASRDRLSFTLDMKKALSGVDLVQENGPERKDFKIQLFAEMDAATPPDSIIASSSSGLTMSVMQSACKHPERCVIGHPFNPPHMIPLVEVVGGEKTSPDVVRRAIEFYASIGKKPIHLRKEVVGHVANRLQAAIYREVVNLINLGVVDVADADTAVCWGPGLRWGVMGPTMLFHLGGGQGGIQHFMEHLSGPVAMWWKDLGGFTEWPAGSKETIVAGVTGETDGRTVDELAQMRDQVLLELVKIRTKQVEATAPAAVR